MAHIRGIGGVFFKSKDPKTLQDWYVKKLGLTPDKEGYIYFMWDELKEPGYTLWGPFPEDTKTGVAMLQHRFLFVVLRRY